MNASELINLRAVRREVVKRLEKTAHEPGHYTAREMIDMIQAFFLLDEKIGEDK